MQMTSSLQQKDTCTSPAKYGVSAIAFVILGMMALWAIDISVSAMNSQKCFQEYACMDADYCEPSGVKTVLSNGFYNVAPERVYHIALYYLVVALFTLASIVVYLSFRLVKARV
jgi:hypothetical protein